MSAWLGLYLGLVRRAVGGHPPTAYTPALKFNDARNSQYAALWG